MSKQTDEQESAINVCWCKHVLTFSEWLSRTVKSPALHLTSFSCCRLSEGTLLSPPCMNYYMTEPHPKAKFGSTNGALLWCSRRQMICFPFVLALTVIYLVLQSHFQNNILYAYINNKNTFWGWLNCGKWSEWYLVFFRVTPKKALRNLLVYEKFWEGGNLFRVVTHNHPNLMEGNPICLLRVAIDRVVIFLLKP